jgi:Tfp pilus assembly protein PilF
MQEKLQYALDLCNKNKFNEALPVLEEITKTDPQNSEAWRVLAQIHWNHSQDPDKAYDELIEALRCDPKNIWALILMGNLLTKEKNDVEHAKQYYDKVLEYYPDNAIAINNIGATFMERKDYEGALPYMEKALSLDDSYANSYYGLALCYYKLGKLKEAFDICHKGAVKSSDRPENPAVREELLKLFLAVAREYAKTQNYINVWKAIKDELEAVDHIKILIKEDKDLMVNARFEYALTHHEKEHIIRYNPDKEYIDHLFVHEMMHLKMQQQATLNHRGKAVVFTQPCQKAFDKKFKVFMQRRHKELPQNKLNEALRFMCEGIGTQLSSCPLDLFVEHMMYSDYPIMRPIQMLSLFHLEEVNIDAIKKGELGGLFPNEIVRASKVMNIVSSLHFKELYGFNFVNQYKPTKAEYNQALDLYEEFKAYLNTYKSGDEYEMMEYFVQSFNMEDFLEIVDENTLIKKDAHDDDTLYDEIDRRLADAPSEEDIDVSNAQFALDHQDGADPMETMMMSMYMLSAMQYFDKISHDDVKKIAFEIATVGINGISPKKKYSIKSIADKEFGGYEFLAYYYVSWAREFPDALDKIGLPFNKAYETALEMYKSKNNKK